VQPAVLDTELYAPRPRDSWAGWATASRPGVRLLETPGSLVRVRDTGGSGPALVLLTDAPHTVESYDDLVAELAPAARLVVLEPPGFGFSWATDPAALGLPGATASVVDALHQLGISGAVLGGACVYGFLALAAAAVDPALAGGLLLAQTPSWTASDHWGRGVLDPQGQLAAPWTGQVGWRVTRGSATESWYRFAAGPDAPVDRWQQTGREVLRAGASYALASQLQAWWGADASGPGPVDLPATVLWGEADRSHRRAGTDPEGVLELLPRGAVVRVPGAGHFVDTEDVATTADQFRRLLDRT
jgi:pimeloyl-ACP methyl ester carboxylesterase